MTPPEEPGVPDSIYTVYVASKSRYGPMWKNFRAAWRDRGIEIISTWIDESEPGATADWGDLWIRCVGEASRADFLIVYSMRGTDDVLKGALVEVGAALGAGSPVYVVGEIDHSWTKHPDVHRVVTLRDAVDHFLASVKAPA